MSNRFRQCIGTVAVLLAISGCARERTSLTACIPKRVDRPVSQLDGKRKQTGLKTSANLKPAGAVHTFPSRQRSSEAKKPRSGVVLASAEIPQQDLAGSQDAQKDGKPKQKNGKPKQLDGKPKQKDVEPKQFGEAVKEEPLTLDDLVEMALSHNPTLALAQAEIEKERGNWTQVGLYPNPTIGYLRSDPTQAGQSRTDGGFVQQQIITGGKLRINREIEDYGIANTGYQRDAQRQRVRNDVKIRFAEVLAARMRVEITAEMVTLAEAGLKTAQQLYEAKQVPLTDVLQAEVQLEVFRSSLERARSGAAVAWQHLADMAGVPQMRPVPLAGDLKTDVLELDREQLKAELVQNNALLNSLRAQQGIAGKTLERQRVQPIPDVTVQFVGEHDHTFNYSTFSTLLALPIPIFDRNQGAIYNAYQEYIRTQREIERTELVLNDQFTASFASYRNGRRDAVRLEKEILPRAKKNLEITTDGYKNKQLSLMQVLAARQTYLDLRTKQVDAMLEMHRAKVELEGLQLTGGLNPATIGAAIQGGGGEATSQRRGVLQNLLQQQQNGRLRLFNPGTTK